VITAIEAKELQNYEENHADKDLTSFSHYLIIV
jgi:hypothetical protein